MDKCTKCQCVELVALSKRAYETALICGTSGNMSCYLGDGTMLITPTSVRYETLAPEDIILMMLDGTVLNGSKKPSSEWRMHAEIYTACPNVRAIIHTHSPYATAFSAVHQEIPAVLTEAHLFLNGGVRCADYATPGTSEVGRNAVSALQDRGGCTLANHGVVAIGENLEQAYLRAEYIEDLAKVACFAKQIGTAFILRDEKKPVFD